MGEASLPWVCFCVESPSSSIYFSYASGLPAPIPSSSGIFSRWSRPPYLLAVRLKCYILCLFHSLPFTFFCTSCNVSFYQFPIPSGSWSSCVLQGVNGCLQNCQGSSSMRDKEKCHFSGPTDQPDLEIIFFSLWFPASVIATWARRLAAASLDTKALTWPASLNARPPTHTHIKRGASYPGERERLFCMFYKGGN